MLTNASGALASSVTRDPWGNPVLLAGGVPLELGYPGQWKDPATGLFQNHHRDYDPTTGRYLQADPVGLGGGSNVYAYVGGDPMNLVDPEGLNARAIGQFWECFTPPGAIVCIPAAALGLAGAMGVAQNATVNRPRLKSTPAPLVRANCPPDRIHPSKCQPLYDDINAAVGWIKRKEYQQAHGSPDAVPGHHKALVDYARNLLKKVNAAKRLGCMNFDPEARRIIHQYLGIVV